MTMYNMLPSRSRTHWPSALPLLFGHGKSDNQDWGSDAVRLKQVVFSGVDNNPLDKSSGQNSLTQAS